MATSYSIGHQVLDDDHDRMIALWRELEASRTLDAAKSTAARLMSEAGDHFIREEQQMLQCGFPDYVRHKALHSEMAAALRRVLLLPLLSIVSHEDFVSAVRSLMEKWVMAHIMGEDSKLAPYLRARAGAVRRPSAARA